MDSQLYKQFILDHYKSPRNWGKLGKDSIKANVENSSCGDEIELFLQIENDKVVDVKFEAVGCAISIASMSILSEKIKGKSLDQLSKISENDILNDLNMPKTSGRIKCATLSLDALKELVRSQSN